MIATSGTFRFLIRMTAPWVWRNRERTSRKLTGFAATEAGSALDMIKAAELTSDAHLRELFFRHAIDEARHARMFQAHAKKIAPNGQVALDHYARIHALRQNLFQRLGLVDFVVFVHLAERRGLGHFEALGQHFANEPQLRALFGAVGRDEQFHVSYTAEIMQQWTTDRKNEVAQARWRVRFARVRDQWLRMGRRIGDGLARTVLAVIYFVVIPLFALAQRLLDPEQTGFHKPPIAPDLENMRRQF